MRPRDWLCATEKHDVVLWIFECSLRSQPQPGKICKITCGRIWAMMFHFYVFQILANLNVDWYNSNSRPIVLPVSHANTAELNKNEQKTATHLQIAWRRCCIEQSSIKSNHVLMKALQSCTTLSQETTISRRSVRTDVVHQRCFAVFLPGMSHVVHAQQSTKDWTVSEYHDLTCKACIYVPCDTEKSVL